MVANYYKPGPATSSDVRDRIAKPSSRGGDDIGSWYVAENYVDGSPEVTADNWLGVDGRRLHQAAPRRGRRCPSGSNHPRMRIWRSSTTQAVRCPCVIRSIPASSKKSAMAPRPTVGTGSSPRRMTLVVGRTCKLRKHRQDSDNDGMPDEWETEIQVQPPGRRGWLRRTRTTTATPTSKEYLNGTDPTVLVDYTKPENNVNTLK